MTLDLRRPFLVFRLLAGMTLVVAVVVHVLGPTGWAFALDAIALGHWLFHVWMVRTLDRRSLPQLLILLCVAQFTTAVLFTAVEPWMLHLTPLICLSPVMVATRFVDDSLYRRLTLSAIAVILAMTIMARLLGGSGPVFAVSDKLTRSVIALVFTPSLAGFVGWIAWRNQRTMVRQTEELAHSQKRLELANETARRRFERSSASMRAELGELRIAVRAALTDHRADLGELRRRVQDLVARLREMARGFVPRDFSLDTEGDRSELAEHIGASITVADDGLGARPPLIDRLVRSVLLELRAGAATPMKSVQIRRSGGDIVVDVVASADADADVAVLLGGLSIESLDRIEAVGGWYTSEPAELAGLRLSLPTSGEGTSTTQAPLERDPAADLRVGVIFPLLGSALVAGVGLSVLRGPEMYQVMVLIGVLYTGPCLAAVGLAGRFPRAAMLGFIMSNWISAIVIADRLDVIKWFGAVALLIPLLLALPYLRGALYTILAVGTFAVTAAMIAIARFGEQIAVATEAPDAVTDITVILLIPVASAVTLVVAQRNHEVLRAATDALRDSRRRIVEASDQATRSIERDLHDGTQQRLVSGALQLQIAQRKGFDERESSLELAASELARAEQSLAGLTAGQVPAELAETGLGGALRDVAIASPVPIDVSIASLPTNLSEHVVSSVWFCCNEAIANAVKHAGDGVTITVDVRATQSTVEFRIVDNGRGFAPASNTGSGLANIRERCTQHGGTVDIASTPGQGTTVRGSVPTDQVPVGSA